MREPKTFDRPRLYYQEARIRDKRMKDLDDSRMRILYPNGRAEFIFEYQTFLSAYDENWIISCWYSFDNDEGEESLNAMRSFDKKRGFKKALFLGEL